MVLASPFVREARSEIFVRLPYLQRGRPPGWDKIRDIGRWYAFRLFDCEIGLRGGCGLHRLYSLHRVSSLDFCDLDLAPPKLDSDTN